MVWRWLPLLVLVSCTQSVSTPPVRPVKAMQVSTTASVTSHLVFPGTLRAFKRADLSFRVDGTVITRDIYVGLEAAAGTLLIQLDPREYEIALKKAQGKLESVAAQLDFAKRDYVRMKNIFEKDPGAISASLLDRKLESANQYQAEWIMAQSDVEKAADDLSYTSLRAPFDGIVAAIFVENHEQIRAKQPVLRFLDITDREMEINIPEKYINALLEGRETLQFQVRLDAFPTIDLAASIKEIGTEAASTTQTYPVTLSLQQIPPEMSLLAGMTGRASLSQAPQQRNLISQIPQSAIFTDDGNQTYVWVVDPSTATVHKKAVTIDPTNKENGVIVQEGLTSGEWIVIAGTSFLIEGQRVKWDSP